MFGVESESTTLGVNRTDKVNTKLVSDEPNKQWLHYNYGASVCRCSTTGNKIQILKRLKCLFLFFKTGKKWHLDSKKSNNVHRRLLRLTYGSGTSKQAWRTSHFRVLSWRSAEDCIGRCNISHHEQRLPPEARRQEESRTAKGTDHTSAQLQPWSEMKGGKRGIITVDTHTHTRTHKHAHVRRTCTLQLG